MSVKIDFFQSREMEARRLLYMAADLHTQDMQNKGFAVLPHLPKSGAEMTVYFPDLNYSEIDHFWEKCSQLILETPIKAPKALVCGMVKLLEPEYKENEYTAVCRRWKTEWRQVEKRFWDRFSEIFTVRVAPVNRIDVYVTKYGPRSTFRLAGKGRRKLVIFLRYDQGMAELMWVILTCFLRPELEKELKFTWEECEAAVDMLMRKTTINCGYKLWKPIMKELRSEQKAKNIEDSRKFLDKLNFHSDVLLWTKTDQQVKYGETELDKLSQNERKLLGFMIEKQGEVVNFDQVLELLWPGNEEILVGTVIKQVQRLRRKLAQYGVPRKVIQTQRKAGYMLVK